ncbi:MAG TPA: NAD(P)/FAD-dependent oxidoreductase [Thermoanaerobaculia bacterium]|nr:NAD(P)/FAD-dependent oxidoreductase [Thermoanaerobaculia bacterium]
MTARDFDVAVVGGGHNALVAAGLLQRRGARVALFEARPQLGGFASPLALGEGVEVPLAVDDWGLVRDDLLAELELERHGLAWAPAEALAALRSEATDGDADLVLWREAGRCAASFEQDAPGDGKRLRRFLAEIGGLVGELEELWRRPPELRQLARFVLSPELLRWCGGSLEELLGAAFDGTRARTAFGALALRGSAWGPSAAGTGILLLHQLAGTTAEGLRVARRPRGGAGAFVAALERSAADAGVQMATGAPVRQILVENVAGGSRAVGLRLANGTEVSARCVLSGLDRRTTLLDLVGPARLPVQSVRRLRHLRHHGVRGRAIVPVAKRAGPALATGEPGVPLLVARGLEQLERAADDAKWGRSSARPWLEVSVWPGRAGGTTWTINAQCAPQSGSATTDGAWASGLRAAIEGVGSGAELAPWRDLTPADWERELGAAGGCEHHGDMLLDQLFQLRGTERAAGARTELQGLLLCGSGAHPGGAVTGLPGWHAAELAPEELG